MLLRASLRGSAGTPVTYVAFAGVALLSGCGGGGGGGGGSAPQPGSIQFETTALTVDEAPGGATVNFTVTRTGGTDGAVAVTVAPSGTAQAGSDHTLASTTVSFGPGEGGAKTLRVIVADDVEPEVDETLDLTLSAPTGGASVGASATARLTIRDNDPPPTPALGEVTADIKQLTFKWTAVPGATSYRLLQNPDGASGFTPIGPILAADATSVTLDIAVHRTDWLKGLYQLEACNGSVCSSPSDSVSAGNAMLDAIGYFKAGNTGKFDEFGHAVAVSDDGRTVAVAAPTEASAAALSPDDDSALGAGAVYVFVRTGAQWSQQAYLKASNAQAGDSFGSSLALSRDGNTLAVSAIGESSSATGINGGPVKEQDNSAGQAGAVYVFARSGPVWLQQAYVKASNTGAGDSFGDSVALSGDGNTLAVGAPGEDSIAKVVNGGPASEQDNNASEAGAVYVFARAGTAWSQQSYVKASNTDAFDRFGRSVALSGDGGTLAVGALGESSSATGVNGGAVAEQNNSAQTAGAVYVFIRDEQSQWSKQAYVKASNTDVTDNFGRAVALSGDGNTLAVGAVNEDSSATGVTSGAVADQNNSADNAGAVYVFARTGTAWGQEAYVKASNTEQFDAFGFSVALSSDGNTLAVATPQEDSNAVGIGGSESNNLNDSAGAVYVFGRTVTQWSQTAYVKASNTAPSLLPGNTVGDRFGHSVALSGDGGVLVAGAPNEDSNATGINNDQDNDDAPTSGAVYVY